MRDWPLTPLVPASHVPKRFRPVIEIPEHRFCMLEEYGNLRADGGPGKRENHKLGILVEDAIARYLRDEDKVDTELYDGGDGGVDLTFSGKSIDAKGASRVQCNPRLIVSAYKPLRADYYALANRIGPRQFRLVGYCPRQFVANARTERYNGEPVHIVPQDDLFPFPFWLAR